jgi:hypothetical protein
LSLLFRKLIATRAGDDVLKKVKQLFSVIILILVLQQPVLGSAAVLDEYEEAHNLYMAAVACTAVYNDRVGEIAREALREDGWQIQSYVGKSSKADARFLMAQKIQPGTTVPFYLLAAVGTETIKDVKADLRVSKVYFAGQTPEEFWANSLRNDIPDSEPKVHDGFNQYAQAGFSLQESKDVDSSQKQLLDVLLADKASKVYLVGHSLGGAGVTILGARLLDMGVKPEQIEVITFGAPAVGNKAFCNKFEPELHVTRVVAAGDPITQALQKLVGGYEQFGREISWQTPKIENAETHQITVYLDLAIKNYYQKRQKAVTAGELSVPNQSVGTSDTPKVYVAPIKNQLPKELQEEFIYMKDALQDEYRSTLPEYVLDTEEEDNDIFKKAIAAGSDLVVTSEIQAHKVKDEKNTTYIALEQRVYRVKDGSVLTTASYSSSTRNLTPLEALIHNAKTMSQNRQEWLTASTEARVKM